MQGFCGTTSTIRSRQADDNGSVLIQIISNIREVQMEINQVTAKLKRTEAIADERMYQVQYFT